MFMKDLLIVTADSMNIIDVFRETMNSCTGLTFDCLDNDTIRKSFRYKNLSQRTYNFFLKNLTGRNLKHSFYNASLEKAITELDEAYKQILIIRPDVFSNRHLQMLRDRTDCFIAYYWDTIDIIPRKQDIIHYFDKIVSFDPSDCNKYGFEFQPNFYYYEAEPKETRYEIYNLSTVDDRKGIIEEVAMALEQRGVSYLIKGFRERPFTSDYIRYTHRVTYREMIEEARYCKVVLDVSKPGQDGLTFRPFEAMGLNKKLITTNTSIRDYEFYDPENVLIVEPGNVCIDSAFFQTPYKEIPKAIKNKYHLKQWLANVLSSESVLAA
jgi:hypothetical protein